MTLYFPDYLNGEYEKKGLKLTEYIIPWLEFEHSISKFGNSIYGQVRIYDFDSLSEYLRWEILVDRQSKGMIKDLARQVEYEFPGEKRIYIPDFTYRDTKTGQYIVEDVKSPRLLHSARFQEAQYLMKKHYNIEIKVVNPKRLME